MGILVYTLISEFIWHRSTRDELEEASRKLFASQHGLYRAYRKLMVGAGTAEDTRALRMHEVELVTAVGQALNAAETDSYTVWEIRHQWRRLHWLSAEFMETLERWRESFPELQGMDLVKPLPNLESACSEIDRRFTAIEGMLAGKNPEHVPDAVTLQFDITESRKFGHFQKAALAVTKTQLDRLDALSRSLFECVQNIKAYREQPPSAVRADTEATKLKLDADAFHGAVTVMLALWVAFLVWIYVDPPGHASFVFMGAHWTMAAVMLRQRVSMLLPGFIVGIVLAGIAYIFVMPHLSGYAQLGLMLFSFTVGIFYTFWAPRLRLTRSVVIAVFQILIVIDNEQTYDFVSYANTSAAILLTAALAAALEYVVFSPRPEKVFMRLLARFFRQAAFMMSRLALERDQRKGWAERWRMALYRNDLLALPEKLVALSQKIDYRVLPGHTPEQMQALATSLETVALRIKELMAARESPQAELLVREYQQDLREWRVLIQEQFRLWSHDLTEAVEMGVDPHARLQERMAKLEARIDETYKQAGEGQLTPQDYENFFRYLGSFRGLSEAGIGYIRLAAKINWRQWQEARF